MQWLYLASLLVGVAGLIVLDWRYKLAFWSNAKRTLLTLFSAMIVFIVWDFLGIAFGIFFHGPNRYSLPFRIAPEFPLEEIVFLFLLTYCTLVVYRGVAQWRSRTSL